MLVANPAAGGGFRIAEKILDRNCGYGNSFDPRYFEIKFDACG
jgi:hypothetical protein